MKQKRRSAATVAALLIFAVFALGILSALLSGAGVYRRLTERSEHAYDSRTCIQYLATRVRQAPQGQVSVGSFGEVQALYFAETIGDEEYVTRVYCYDGWLMELFCAADGSFYPDAGEKILPLEAMTVELEDGLLTLTVTEETGKVRTLYLNLPCGEGAGS